MDELASEKEHLEYSYSETKTICIGDFDCEREELTFVGVTFKSLDLPICRRSMRVWFSLKLDHSLCSAPISIETELFYTESDDRALKCSISEVGAYRGTRYLVVQSNLSRLRAREATQLGGITTQICIF